MPKGICDSCDAPIDASDWWKPHNLCRLCEEDIASPEKNDKEQLMTTTNTTPILELWNAMRDAGIQPPEIDYIREKWFYNKHWVGLTEDDSILLDEHAGFILTGHAEAWLIDERGWTMYRTEGRVKYCPPITGQHHSLPDALRAEAGRE